MDNTRIRACARPTARRIRSLACPSGRRAPESVNPEVCNRASANRSSAASFSTRRRSFDLLPEFLLREIRHLQTDHDRRRGAEPPSRRRARDPEIRGDGQVPGALDKIPEPMVIALLRAGRGRHPDDHRPFAHAAQLLKDDAGRRVGVTTTRARKCKMSAGDSSARIHPPSRRASPRFRVPPKRIGCCGGSWVDGDRGSPMTTGGNLPRGRIWSGGRCCADRNDRHAGHVAPLAPPSHRTQMDLPQERHESSRRPR